MIGMVRIRGFKRFEEVEFRLPGHVVLAGPSDTGKETALNDPGRHGRRIGLGRREQKCDAAPATATPGGGAGGTFARIRARAGR